MKHLFGTGLTAAVGAALCLPMLSVTTAATAHEGHDDTAPPPPAGSFQKVHPRRPSGRGRSTSPCCPTVDVLAHHAHRRASAQHDAETGVNTSPAADPGLPP